VGAIETFMGPGSAEQFVIDVNVRRRHLEPPQRLNVLSEINRIAGLRAAARDRQNRDVSDAEASHLRANLPEGSNTTNVVDFHVSSPVPPRARGRETS
jgi:hypothetical protein